MIFALVIEKRDGAGERGSHPGNRLSTQGRKMKWKLGLRVTLHGNVLDHWHPNQHSRKLCYHNANSFLSLSWLHFSQKMVHPVLPWSSNLGTHSKCVSAEEQIKHSQVSSRKFGRVFRKMYIEHLLGVYSILGGQEPRLFQFLLPSPSILYGMWYHGSDKCLMK